MFVSVVHLLSLVHICMWLNYLYLIYIVPLGPSSVIRTLCYRTAQQNGAGGIYRSWHAVGSLLVAVRHLIKAVLIASCPSSSFSLARCFQYSVPCYSTMKESACGDVQHNTIVLRCLIALCVTRTLCESASCFG